MTADATLTQAFQHLQSGQIKQAMRTAKTGLRSYPKDPRFENLMGMALAQSGDVRAAVPHFAKAYRADPAAQMFQDNLVTALVQTGQADKARGLIETLIPRRADQSELYFQLALLERAQGAIEAALAAADQAVSAQEAHGRKGQALARFLNLRGVIHGAAGDEAAALADYERALEAHGDAPEILANIAPELARILQPDLALAALEKALTLQPNHLNALQRYGVILNSVGRTDEARRALRLVLQASPYHADTLRILAGLARADEAAALKPALSTAFAKTPKNTLQRAMIAFGQAHVAETLGDTDEMIRRYADANRMAADLRPHDRAKWAAQERRVTELFAVDAEPPKAEATAGARLVFVVGLPHAGTTLVERILSAHRDVTGLGEQTTALRLARPYLSADTPFDQDAARQFARAYRDALPDAAVDARWIVDATSANYKAIGCLLCALPDAIVLNVARDPRAVGWSIWRSYFPNAPMNYGFDQTAMAEEINAYARYMALWTRCFPGRIHHVSYADIVADIVPGSRALADLCGLEWGPAMAEPERNPDQIRTGDAIRERLPVQQRQETAWRTHAESLSHFVSALDPELWPEIGTN